MGINEIPVSVKPVSLKKDDILLVEVNARINVKQQQAIKRAVEKWSGGKHEVLVVDTTLLRVRQVTSCEAGSIDF